MSAAPGADRSADTSLALLRDASGHDHGGSRDAERAVLLWTLARRAMRLALADPEGLGGVVLHGRHGPSRDALLAELAAYGAVRRVPPDIDEEALGGGIDTTATLAAGRPVRQRGLLDAAGLVSTDLRAELRACHRDDASSGSPRPAPSVTTLLFGAVERLADGPSACLCVWLDGEDGRGEGGHDGRGDPVHDPVHDPVQDDACRDGFGRAPRRAAVVALDESLDESPLIESALGERLALHVEVPTLALAELRRASEQALSAEAGEYGRSRPGGADEVTLPDDLLEEIVRTSARLGIVSSRGAVQACRAARVAAWLDGRATVAVADAALAVQLVLAPRARVLPDIDGATDEPAPDNEPDNEPDDEPPSDPVPGEPAPPEGASDVPPPESDESPRADEALPERLVEAALAALPPGLLEQLVAGHAARGADAGRDGGARAADERRGRPIGVRRPRGAGRGRLALVATLKAAIPYQRLRAASPAPASAATGAPAADSPSMPRLRVRREDLRVIRYRRPTRTTTVFVVDASGSAAMHRLAEAKGAVESLLAECYVRRDRVALITFRGDEATLELPPTRSLVRARRALVGLPGGGGTPLAAGFDLAADVLERLAQGGENPLGVFMTDASANVARDGTGGRAAARADAEQGAARLARIGARLLFVDTAPRPRPDAARFAALMRARYLALPQLDPALLGAGGAGAAAR